MFVICKWAQTLALPEDGDISRRRITLFEDLLEMVLPPFLLLQIKGRTHEQTLHLMSIVSSVGYSMSYFIIFKDHKLQSLPILNAYSLYVTLKGFNII